MDLLQPGNVLTKYEKAALSKSGDATHGHAIQRLNPSQQAVIDRMDQLYIESPDMPYDQIVEEFTKAIFGLNGQLEGIDKYPAPNFYDSASVGIQEVGHVLKERGMSVALAHPTFDSIHALFRNLDLVISPLDEKLLKNPSDLVNDIGVHNADALFIVNPTNPTGEVLSAEEFGKLLDYCKVNGKTLIVDASFRLFSDEARGYDQYQMAIDAGVEFVGIEDTGKFFPIQDMKVGTVVASEGFDQRLKANLQMTHSEGIPKYPFVMRLLTEFIKIETDQILSANQLMAQNRAILHEALIGSPLIDTNPNTTVSVAFLKLPEGWKASEFQAYAISHDIHILPGGPFFWHDQELGEGYIRVALSRDPEYVQKVFGKLAQISREYDPTKLDPLRTS